MSLILYCLILRIIQRREKNFAAQNQTDTQEKEGLAAAEIVKEERAARNDGDKEQRESELNPGLNGANSGDSALTNEDRLKKLMTLRKVSL